MGENVVTLGLYTLRDFNSTDEKLKPCDHLFGITYMKDREEHEIMLLWKRGKKVFTRTLNHGIILPIDTKSVMQFARLTAAAVDILDGKEVNLLEI